MEDSSYNIFKWHFTLVSYFKISYRLSKPSNILNIWKQYNATAQLKLKEYFLQLHRVITEWKSLQTAYDILNRYNYKIFHSKINIRNNYSKVTICLVRSNLYNSLHAVLSKVRNIYQNVLISQPNLQIRVRFFKMCVLKMHCRLSPVFVFREHTNNVYTSWNWMRFCSFTLDAVRSLIKCR